MKDRLYILEFIQSRYNYIEIKQRNMEASLPAEYSYRRATLDDYEAVVDIDKTIYGGYDYLPALYKQYMEDNTKLCYVGLHKNKVVSLSLKVE